MKINQFSQSSRILIVALWIAGKIPILLHDKKAIIKPAQGYKRSNATSFHGNEITELEGVH